MEELVRRTPDGELVKYHSLFPFLLKPDSCVLSKSHRSPHSHCLPGKVAGPQFKSQTCLACAGRSGLRVRRMLRGSLPLVRPGLKRTVGFGLLRSVYSVSCSIGLFTSARICLLQSVCSSL